jgi:hypothetical protein
MQKVLHALFIVLVLTACSAKSQNVDSKILVSDEKVLAQLLELGDKQNFFELETAFQESKDQLSKDHNLYFAAIIENAFNNPKGSNRIIEELEEMDHALDDSLVLNLYELKIMNHVNQYEYQLAKSTTDKLLSEWSVHLDSIEIAEFKNANKIWSSLSNVRKQEVIRNTDFTIPLTTDIAGLLNIAVDFNQGDTNFIFDTGANFSVIRKSLAKELNMEIIESDFQIDAFTGLKIESDLAVADRLDIGGLTCRNVVFLVLKDDDLTFPGYSVNGIIGYPVIEAMKEIHITQDNQLFIPKELNTYKKRNFALDGLMPIVAVRHKDEDLIFHFDTGAKSTSLFPTFFESNRKDIEGKYNKQNFSSTSGGGEVEFEGYVLPELKISVADSEKTLKNIELHIHDLGNEENNFHGNLGQDYIKQFDKMIISFEYSAITFK